MQYARKATLSKLVALSLILSVAVPYGMRDAHAATSTGVLAVSATVLSICVVAAAPLLFGNYTASSGTPTDASAIITATCTPGSGYTLALNGGTTVGGTVAQRKMQQTLGADTLDYQLYTASDYGTVWGDATGSSQTVASTGTGLPQLLSVYGRIPTGQYVGAGAYTDVVTVTLTY